MPLRDHASFGAAFVGEFFADLSYGPAGELIIPRTQSAVDVEKAAARLDRAVREGKVEAVDGTLLDISFSTVCIHSDPPNARDVAAGMRRVLDAAQR
ncbi:MAG: LamB/YcsF family protein [Stenotrophomonas acidaminiphila]|nr:LamB/YcsF family protein [Stenotrophomonas acidaminiphila]